jgi:hypothetical protein
MNNGLAQVVIQEHYLRTAGSYCHEDFEHMEVGEMHLRSDN